MAVLFRNSCQVYLSAYCGMVYADSRSSARRCQVVRGGRPGTTWHLLECQRKSLQLNELRKAGTKSRGRASKLNHYRRDASGLARPPPRRLLAVPFLLCNPETLTMTAHMHKKHQAPGQLAYTALGANPQALEAFFRGLDTERRWFACRPRAKEFRRALSKGERLRLGYPPGSVLLGHRLSNGRVAWFVSYPRPTVGGAVEQPTSEEQLRDIAAAVVKSMRNTRQEATGGMPATSPSNASKQGPAADPGPASNAPKPNSGDTDTANATTRILESRLPPPPVMRSIFTRLMKRCIAVVQRTFSLFSRSFK